jgi:glycosyltransferase involved in cell wall biosynthesis
MKVLHITNNYPTVNHPIFGIFVKEQIDSLSALGIENKVFFINSREKGAKEYIIGYFKLIVHLFTHKYDVIHCHHSFSAIIYIATFFPLFNKSIASFQNDPSREFNGKLFPIINLFFNKIILKNKSEVYMKYPKCIYFPNGVNIDLFQPMDKDICKKKLGLDQSKKYILFFDSNKGKRTQKRYDIFKDIIVKLRIEGYLEIEEIVLTNTSRELIPLYMNASELHLLCSDFEGSPNSVKECMACNTKVVSTDVGNVRELFKNTDGYFVSNTNNIDELFYLIELSLKSKNINGRDVLISKKLDIESVGTKLIEIYKSI